MCNVHLRYIYVYNVHLMISEFIKSMKGNDLLLHERYIFSRRKQLTSGETV